MYVSSASLLNIGLEGEPTLALLKKILKNKKSYSYQFEKDNYTFDILEIGESFVFGTCAKENELKYTNFWQIRNKETIHFSLLTLYYRNYFFLHQRGVRYNQCNFYSHTEII